MLGLSWQGDEAMKKPTNSPRIGMVGYYIGEEEEVGGKVRGIPHQAFSMFSYNMVQAIFQAGGVAIPLPVIDKKYIKKQFAQLDAIVFSGGEDIEPKRYGADSTFVHVVDPVRDTFELELLELALEANIPILCVCRGMQLLNVYCGGTLYTDINESFAEHQNHWETVEPWKPIHEVKLKSDHFATDIFGADLIQVNSIHHQAVKRVGANLEAVGWSKDQVIEILAMKDRDNVLGVQWHPEMMIKDNQEGLRPFKWLIDQTMTSSME